MRGVCFPSIPPPLPLHPFPQDPPPPSPSPSLLGTPTYMPPRGHLGHGAVDAVGASVEGAGIAQVVPGLGVPPPQGGPGGTAVGTLAALTPVVKPGIYWEGDTG